MRHIVRVLTSCQPHMQFGEKTFSAFESNAYGLMGFKKVRSGFFHRSNSTAESATVSSPCLICEKREK